MNSIAVCPALFTIALLENLLPISSLLFPCLILTPPILSQASSVTNSFTSPCCNLKSHNGQRIGPLPASNSSQFHVIESERQNRQTEGPMRTATCYFACGELGARFCVSMELAIGHGKEDMDSGIPSEDTGSYFWWRWGTRGYCSLDRVCCHRWRD